MIQLFKKDISRYYQLKNIFEKMKSFFYNYNDYNYRIKDIKDMMAIILFFKNNNDEFYPSDDKWKAPIIKKLSYMFDDFENKFTIITNFIEKIYKEEQQKNYEPSEVNVNVTETKIKIGDLPIINIPKKLYDKLNSTIKDEYKKEKDNIIALTLLRYEILLDSKNHQLGIDYNKYNIENHDVELFASPINRTLKEFCALYPDIDKYYKGSLGSFFNYKFQKNKNYTFNPPYIEELMENGVKYLIKGIENIENINVFITIPIWDDIVINSLKTKENDMIFNIKKIHKYPPYDILKKYDYTSKIKILSLESYKYYNHFIGKFISVANTFHIFINK